MRHAHKSNEPRKNKSLLLLLPLPLTLLLLLLQLPLQLPLAPQLQSPEPLNHNATTTTATAEPTNKALIRQHAAPDHLPPPATAQTLSREARQTCAGANKDPDPTVQ
jgi:hypothetical protein